MGQIFDRMSRLAKAYFNDAELPRRQTIINEDDELKKIIDEIDREAPKQDSSGSTGKSQKYKKMDISKAYSVLGVNPNANTEDIKRAYIQKMKEYHPDKVENLGEELKDLARRKTSEINEAYDIIKKNRADY